MARPAAIALLVLASLAGRCVLADPPPLSAPAMPEEPAEGDLFWIKPSIQIGAHAETGGGVLPGSGFAPKEDGGGVALAFTLMAPARPRLMAGLAGEMSGAHAALAAQTPIGAQTYGVASVRVMARVEYWTRPPFDRERHDHAYYALFGAGWNYNGVGTRITFLAGAPDGTAGDLHFGNRPGFELGGGTEWLRYRDGILIFEAAWVYDRGPYRLQVFGEPDRRGTFDVSGITILIGMRFNPPRSGL